MSFTIQLGSADPQRAGFISWKRLAAEMIASCEIKAPEKVVRFEVSERGINYFVAERDRS